MEHIGKPVEIDRKFVKFIEEEVEPEYKRVFELLLQQIKDELDEKYLNKDESDNT